MKLEEGMYVRTKNGKIWTINSQQAISGHRKDIINASYNIIDLLEVGDVITTNNLCGEVTKIDIKNNKIWITCCDYETCRSEDIKTILTKEQFESMQYKVGE